MFNSGDQIELLAPAGSYETFRAVVRAGADAVYMGGTDFGARAFAGNLSTEEYLKALDEAHLFGVKVYLTLNTLVKNREMDERLFEFLKPLYEGGLDGAIVQDLGVVSFLRDEFPELPVHASTQMNVTDEYSAAFLKGLGICRVVPARELSLDEVGTIAGKTGLETECFAHGALCYAYSGQCLMSSFIGGRSGNRGRCAQTCRLPFTVNGREGTWLSRRDLCTLDILPDIIHAGVDSLKIEGRMRSPEYAAGVTEIYRKCIDKAYDTDGLNWKVDPEDVRNSRLLFYRGKTTTGFSAFTAADNCAKKHAIILPEKAEALPVDEKKAYEKQVSDRFVGDKCTEQLSLTADIYASVVTGEPMELTLVCGDHSVSVTGDEVQKAQNRPMTEENVAKRLAKLGGTYFSAGDVEVGISDDAFVPVGALNALRRDAFSALENEILSEFKRSAADGKKPFRHEGGFARAGGSGLKVSGTVVSAEQALACAASGADRIVLETDAIGAAKTKDTVKAVREACGNYVEVVLALPRILREECLPAFEKQFEVLSSAGADGWLFRTVGELEFLKCHEARGIFIADANVYMFNERALSVLAEAGADEFTYPLELNEGELKHLPAGILEVYGRAPLMLSANCVRGDTGGHCPGSPADFTYMSDRKQAKLPVMSLCGKGYSVIYNSVPTYLIDRAEDVRRIGPAVISCVFTDESPAKVRTVCEQAVMLKNGKAGEKQTSPADEITRGKFTRGHFKRGVD